VPEAGAITSRLEVASSQLCLAFPTATRRSGSARPLNPDVSDARKLESYTGEISGAAG
jgi:hypothetical protein